jgi:hypothetical protein
MHNINLSPHFELREFTESATAMKHGIDNRPTPEVVENLRQLCTHTLEPLREKLGLPIVITSGFRTKELNDIIVHASRKSQHMEGRAADFYVAQGPVQGSRVQGSRELLIKAFRLIITDESIDFDQLILYPTFIHGSYVSQERNRHQITKANGNGTYCALSRAQALALS